MLMMIGNDSKKNSPIQHKGRNGRGRTYKEKLTPGCKESGNTNLIKNNSKTEAKCRKHTSNQNTLKNTYIYYSRKRRQFLRYLYGTFVRLCIFSY